MFGVLVGVGLRRAGKKAIDWVVFPVRQRTEKSHWLILTARQLLTVSRHSALFSANIRQKAAGYDIISTTANSLNLPTLKEEQRRVAKALLEGKDVLGILPTGFGKSFIFQVFVKAKSRGSRDLDCL